MSRSDLGRISGPTAMSLTKPFGSSGLVRLPSGRSANRATWPMSVFTARPTDQSRRLSPTTRIYPLFEKGTAAHFCRIPSATSGPNLQTPPPKRARFRPRLRSPRLRPATSSLLLGADAQRCQGLKGVAPSKARDLAVTFFIRGPLDIKIRWGVMSTQHF